MGLSAISETIPTGNPIPSSITLKHHLFNARISKKSPKEICESAMNDKQDEFGKAGLFRKVSKLPLAKTPNALEGVVFGLWWSGNFPHLQGVFLRYSSITFIGTKKKATQAAARVANAALTNRISFYGTPDIILTGKDSRVTGSGFPQCVTRKTLLYRRLFHVITKV